MLRNPLTCILQPHFIAYPTLVIPYSSSYALSAPSPAPVPFNASSFELTVVPSSFISCNGTDFRVLLPESVKINNIISTLSQFSINDFEARLSRHSNHRDIRWTNSRRKRLLHSNTERKKKHSIMILKLHLLIFYINIEPRLNVIWKGVFTDLQKMMSNCALPLNWVSVLASFSSMFISAP